MIPRTIRNTKLKIFVRCHYIFVKFVIYDPMSAFAELGQQNK